MNGQQSAILLRLTAHENRAKWWRRREFRGDKNLRADLERLAREGYLELVERTEYVGSEEYKRPVKVTMYRLAKRYRDDPQSLPIPLAGV